MITDKYYPYPEGGPPHPAYCPCCTRLSDCCICHSAGKTEYYGEKCNKCLPLDEEPIIIEANKR